MKFNKSKPELIEDLSEGCKKLANHVGCTMGPRGRNVLLDPSDDEVISTKDGVTVAKFFDLNDKYENLGAKVIKQSAIQTNKEAGDGTTTSTVLANAIFQHASQYLSSSPDVAPKILRRTIENQMEEALDFLQESSRPIKSREDVKHIAKISSNGDEDIAEMIAQAVDKVGKDGSIIVEESGKTKTNVDYVEGFQFRSGYTSSRYVNDERNQKVHYEDKDPLLLVTDHKVNDVQDMIETLSKAEKDGRPLIFIATDIKGQAHAALVTNAIRGTMDIASIKAPYYGERRKKFLEDLATSVGAKFISKDRGDKLSEVKFSDLGACDSIEITQNKTTIVGGKGDPSTIKKKIDGLKEKVKREEDIEKAEKIQERITRLNSGVAVINVGASTQVELTERKHRIEDALEAVRSAQEDGILPGGGVMLLRAAERIDESDYKGDRAKGAEIFKKALKSPLQRMCKNGDYSSKLIAEKILSQDDDNKGYDLMKGEMVDMYEAGVIDPLKVTKNALKSAVSSASTLLMTNSAIVEKVDGEQ